MKVRNGNIIVTTPFQYNSHDLNQFISKRIEKRASHIEKRYDNFIFSPNNSCLWIFGNKAYVDYKEEKGRSRLHLKINDSQQPKTILDLEQIHFAVFILAPQNYDNQKIINSFYRKFEKKYLSLFHSEIERIASLYNVKVESFTFKRLFGSWGICKTKKNQVVLSKKLIHYPYRLQYYVMVHEISHILEPNHSKRFWKIVSQQCPNYLSLRKELRW